MRCTHVGLCSSLPLSLTGPKGEGDKGGEGSLGGQGDSPKDHIFALDTTKRRYYHTLRPNINSRNLRRNQKPRGTNPAPERHAPENRGTQRPGPSQRPPSSIRPELVEGSQERKREACGTSEKSSSPRSRGRHLLSKAPGGLNVLAHPNASPLPRRSDRPVAPLRGEQVAAQAKSLPPRRRGTPSPPPQSRPITFPCPPGDGKTPWIEATADRPFPRRGGSLGGWLAASLRYIKLGVGRAG